jgi:hypothetical protein
MDTITRFLEHYSYLFPKGYPDMNDNNDILLLEQMISEVLGEAFSVFPTTEDEIDDQRIKEIYKTIMAYPGLKLNDPVVLEPEKSPNVLKIARSLQRDSKFIEYINNELDIELDGIKGGKYNGISILWGDGSRGGRGIKSKGLGFEKELVKDLELLNSDGISEDNKDQFLYPDLIIEISKELGLKSGNFEVIPEGDKNQRRPLSFESGGPEIKFSQHSAAETLTDVTIIKGEEKYYLSAKYGNTLTFFNSGIKKILSANEIKNGKITNSDGIALLDTFGIDNETFCKVFNDYPDGDFSGLNGASTKYDISKIKNLVKSGIGEGYYMVKAGGGSTQFFKIDSKYADTSSDVSSPIIYYGGIGGKGKRIDVTFESSTYKFKINIRDKEGLLYPTHIMCDYFKK